MTSECLSHQVASTADGAIACADGTSQWITGPLARAHAQLLRAASQAILVGSGTALADAPRLTVRLPEEQVPTGWLPPRANPLRILLDARGRVMGGPLLETKLAPTLVFTTAASRGNAARAAWAAAGVEVCEVAAETQWPLDETQPATSQTSRYHIRQPAGDETQAAGASANGSGVSVGALSDGGDGVALGAVLDELGARGIIQLMVEGGGAVHGAFLSTPGLAQQLRLYIGATALGSTSRRWIQAPIASTINEAPRWKLLDLERLGEDVCVDYALE